MLPIVLSVIMQFPVVTDGTASCSLVSDASAPVDAVSFFTNAVSRMTGVSLPVVREDVRGNRIVFDIAERGLIDEDDWAVSFPDERTLKVSGTELSCRWAINRIVENWGVVFCQPGSYGTHYPKARNLGVARKPLSGTAAFKLSRDLYIEDPQWLRALGCKSLRDANFFGHAMYRIFPLSKYGKSPWLEELMPEKNLKREKPRNRYACWQPCWASAKGRAEAVKNICGNLRRKPGLKTVSLSVNDTEGYCTCAKCKEMNGGTFASPSRFGKRYKNHSESYYRWVNAVAEGVLAEFPDVWFGVLAYCGTIDPPSFKLNPRVVPFLCCETYQMQDKKVAADREKLFAAWSEKAEAFGLWDYAYGCRSYQAPRMYLKTMTEYFALKKKYPKLQAFFMEGDTFVGEGPKRYLYGKLVSDPDCDAEAELKRWYDACCGKAAAADLRAYYQLWEDFYAGEAVKESLWYKRGIGQVYMDFDQFNYLFALRDEERRRADELALRIIRQAEEYGDADQRARAKDFALWHRLYAARQIAGGAGLAAADGKFRSKDDAVSFFARLHEMEEAQREVISLTREIIDRRLAKGGDDGRLRHHCDGFARKSRRVQNMLSLMNEAVEFIDEPSVRTAIASALENSQLDPKSRDVLAGLLSFARTANRFYPEGLTSADDLELWTIVDNGVVPADRGKAANGTRSTGLVNEKGGWPAAVRIIPDIDPTFDHLLRLRIVNESKGTIRPRICCSPANPETYRSVGGGNGIEKIVAIEPGEAKSVSLFCCRPGEKMEKAAARIYVILNALPKGQGVTVDSCEFKPLKDADREKNEKES